MCSSDLVEHYLAGLLESIHELQLLAESYDDDLPLGILLEQGAQLRDDDLHDGPHGQVDEAHTQANALDSTAVGVANPANVLRKTRVVLEN